MATIANSPISAKPAEAPVPQKKTKSWIPFTMSVLFLFGLIAVPAVSAAEFNLTAITDVINSFIDLIAPITDLIIAIVPLWFILQILAFIMGIMAAVLGMIKLGKVK